MYTFEMEFHVPLVEHTCIYYILLKRKENLIFLSFANQSEYFVIGTIKARWQLSCSFWYMI